VIQAQTGGIVIGVVAPVVPTVVMLVTLEAAWVAVVMIMEVATAQLLHPIIAAQLMVPMGGHMVMEVVLVVMGVMLALSLVLALLMVVPCMVPHMALMGHMVVPTVHLEAMAQEDMVGMVGMVEVEAWMVVAPVVVAQAADTIHMENEH
jgi:hypothetical protein